VTASFLTHGPCLDRRTGLTWSTSRRRRRNDKPCAIAYSGERHLATKIGPRQLLVGLGLRRPDNRVAVPERPPMAAKQDPSIPSFSKFGACHEWHCRLSHKDLRQDMGRRGRSVGERL
jgi:hypothetical protein